jgi:hypothetical protein
MPSGIDWVASGTLGIVQAPRQSKSVPYWEWQDHSPGPSG